MKPLLAAIAIPFLVAKAAVAADAASTPAAPPTLAPAPASAAAAPAASAKTTPGSLKGVGLIGIGRMGDNAVAILEIPVPGKAGADGRPEHVRRTLRLGQAVPTTGFVLKEILADEVVLAAPDGQCRRLAVLNGNADTPAAPATPVAIPMSGVALPAGAMRLEQLPPPEEMAKLIQQQKARLKERLSTATLLETRPDGFKVYQAADGSKIYQKDGLTIETRGGDVPPEMLQNISVRHPGGEGGEGNALFISAGPGAAAGAGVVSGSVTVGGGEGGPVMIRQLVVQPDDGAPQNGGQPVQYINIRAVQEDPATKPASEQPAPAPAK
jgi:hypothetical protein